MDYGFAHQYKVYTPNGTAGIPVQTNDERNMEIEQKEIEWLKTGPDKVMAYIRKPTGEEPWAVTLWRGTVVSQWCSMGDRSIVGFQSCFKGGTYRRPMSCRIFGVLYHGWYMESSGDYCRLKRAKRQNG